MRSSRSWRAAIGNHLRSLNRRNMETAGAGANIRNDRRDVRPFVGLYIAVTKYFAVQTESDQQDLVESPAKHRGPKDTRQGRCCNAEVAETVQTGNTEKTLKSPPNAQALPAVGGTAASGADRQRETSTRPRLQRLASASVLGLRILAPQGPKPGFRHSSRECAGSRVEPGGRAGDSARGPAARSSSPAPPAPVSRRGSGACDARLARSGGSGADVETEARKRKQKMHSTKRTDTMPP